MNYTANDHTWVLCAYGESPFLEECIHSIQAQTVQSTLIISTATPSHFLTDMADRYGLQVFTHEGAGIGRDWNAAFDLAQTPLVTLAHQDDLYQPDYARTMLRELNRSRDPILFFSDSAGLRSGCVSRSGRNLKIKRCLLFPLRFRLLQRSRFVRRRVLSLGCPVCCPAVTYVRTKVGPAPFSTTLKVSLDWDQWERLSRLPGDFVYYPAPLMYHRVHQGSETTKMIADHRRRQEDLELFRRFWPEIVAQALARRYAKSEKANTVK